MNSSVFSILQGMGWEQEDQLAIGAAGAVLAYLKETQRSSLTHIQQLLPHRRGQALEIDSAYPPLSSS
jgi:DNA mismatch repair protein MutS